MAMAVQKLFPDAKVTIGPWIENGFYYDFDMEPLTDKELKRIKKEMDRIIGRNLPLIREGVSRDEALYKRITALNEPYKLEILDSIKEDPITIYHIGKGFTIFRVNIVWKNDAGGGLVLWHPKGAIVRHVMEDLWKTIYIECGYDLLYTPHVAKGQISCHLDYYKENMYDQMNVEDELYPFRPMNCPYHILVYKRKPHSYHEFPVRVAELGAVYRYELSGSLPGLFRVRGFTQVDFNLPQRFDLTYADSNSEKKRPIMIHRAVLGSLKRFFGVLREHYAGDFPLWLSPVQAHVLPVTDSLVCKAVARLMFQLNQEPSTHLHDGYLGYEPRLSSQRFDSSVDSESLKDSATDSLIFHGSTVDDAFATQPASEAFSPPLIYAESNGRCFDGGFGGSDDPILPAPSEMLPEEGFALREWRSPFFTLGLNALTKVIVSVNADDESIHLLPEASSTRSGRLHATTSSSSRGVIPPDCVISVMRFSSTKLRQRPWCRYPYPESRIPVSKPSDTRIHLSNAVSVDPDTYPTCIRPYQRRIVSICVSDTRYAADVPCLCIVDEAYRLLAAIDLFF
ncbi:hypothetical protein C1H46_015730 [Malus baccata]|uniref:threonine--tRNA ligase n=1 Tax=Malus baccata TaxID=106549 RepID=A0A540MIS4_MALBA|nr:hypothetical protein C1H46_015730 [Malus baccata]